ncbi:MAG: hypothetical protein A4E62_02347 [Syntrophorhabdus sp. PtaU1.Bin002]|nr:MAG: hypothetical protein A4E62_02347 [Syntrophorhabdus sp. PtaU1.Bin002]
MSIAIVDARGWQNTLDLKTGEKIDAAGPVIKLVKDVLQRHPYPGDTDPGSNRWVSDTAFDLIDRYAPRFVFLTYAAQYFSGRYTPMSKETRARMISDVFLEAERFINRSGFAAIAVGTGDMTPLLGFIDVTRLDGLAVCTHWSTRYAGLYGPSPDDMKILEEHPHIEKIVSQEEVVRLFDGTPEQTLRLPEYLMLAREGYAFKTISDAMRIPVMIPSLNFNVPLHAPGHTVEAITGIRQILEEDLSEKNVALIAIEGVGLDEFLWPHRPCRNSTEWYYYEPGEAQYLTIVSGRHRFLDYPTGSGYKYFNGAEGAARSYPFSGHFKSIPEGAFASTFPGKSIAVGNKSMFMHMVTGADLSVECFARNLYNQGTMAVIHRADKL